MLILFNLSFSGGNATPERSSTPQPAITKETDQPSAAAPVAAPAQVIAANTSQASHPATQALVTSAAGMYLFFYHLDVQIVCHSLSRRLITD